MVGGVDTSGWKPRRTRGTVVYKIRNYFAYSVIGLGILCGVTYHLLPMIDNLRVAVRRNAVRTEEEIDRRELMNFNLVPSGSSHVIKERIDKEKYEEI